ncbi:MAG: four helix bundle protein [Crocinitomicaceae bacterium]|nr:four helix bundle protein [Crocinitomicaceae bacterium]
MDLNNLEISRQCLKIQEMIFFITQRFPKYGPVGLTEKLRKTSLKIINNIEEGLGVSQSIESMHQLNKALSELETLAAAIRFAKEKGYMGLLGYELIALNINECKSSVMSHLVHIKRKQIA